MILSYRYKLKPTAAQHRALREALDHCRHLYNAALTERIDCYRKTGRGRTLFDQYKALTELRKSGSRYSAVMERAPLKALDEAYKAFFKRGGFPRFKGSDRFKSIGWAEAAGWQIKDRRFIAKGIGAVRIHMHREMRGVMKSCRIKREGRHWYLSVACEVVCEMPTDRPSVGIDFGVADLAILSDGTRIANPRTSKRFEKKIKRKQRALSRCKSAAKRRRKVREQLARMHAKIRNVRSTYLHQVSARLTQHFSFIAVEGLSVSNMTRSAKGTIEAPGRNIAAKAAMNKAIHDASWTRLKELVRYKAELKGGSVVEVNPRGTSQICSGCGTIVRKALRCRRHECPDCGLSIDRDHNAAINVLHRAVTRPGLAKPVIASA